MGDVMNLEKMHQLEREALQSCEFRGYKMTPFKMQGSYWSRSFCSKCGYEVDCMRKPPPNGAQISGEAVALNCK